jgi:hypothetical protein
MDCRASVRRRPPCDGSRAGPARPPHRRFRSSPSCESCGISGMPKACPSSSASVAATETRAGPGCAMSSSAATVSAGGGAEPSVTAFQGSALHPGWGRRSGLIGWAGGVRPGAEWTPSTPSYDAVVSTARAEGDWITTPASQTAVTNAAAVMFAGHSQRPPSDRSTSFSACALRRAVRWKWVGANPVTDADPPAPPKARSAVTYRCRGSPHPQRGVERPDWGTLVGSPWSRRVALPRRLALAPTG